MFSEEGVPVPRGFPAFSPDEAKETAVKLGGSVFAVKAQIHTGGRGKGGGIKIAKSIDEVKSLAESILGSNLVTHQTGSGGKKVNRLLIEEGVNIQSEFYAGIALDRTVNRFAFMVSTEGGVDIEKVADETPEKIYKQWIDPAHGLTPFQARNLAFSLDLKGSAANNCVKTLLALWRTFQKNDCSLAEINPLVLTKEGKIIALDAKMNFDDNAMYRHKNILEMRDLTEELESEIEASKHNLNYIKLDGNVGCMVNGAGLAMATMDIIKLFNGEPANFLDVGGVANSETVAQGFKIILSDPAVKSILINIFGGIVRCDRVAQGVIDALSKMHVTIPVVVRLEGTNAEKAADLLNNSSLDLNNSSLLMKGPGLIDFYQSELDDKKDLYGK